MASAVPISLHDYYMSLDYHYVLIVRHDCHGTSNDSPNDRPINVLSLLLSYHCLISGCAACSLHLEIIRRTRRGRTNNI